MGSAFSSSSSYLQYKNDFELVIRSTKDLEYLLENEFGAPCGKTVGLHDKITAAQQSHGLSNTTVKKLRYLVTIRNKLVHDLTSINYQIERNSQNNMILWRKS